MIVLIDGYGSIEASPLDVVRLVASSMGINDVDVEPGILERHAIRSSAGTSNGNNLAEACTIFLKDAFSRVTVSK